jgi:hypothetical protein
MTLFDDELGGPLDLIFGLPVHPLVVHSAVVLVPLVAIAGLVMSYLPSFSRRYGKPIVIIALIAQLSLFAAKSSGEAFEERLGKEVERHANFGEVAPWTMLPLLILLYLRWRMDREGANIGSVALRRTVSVLLVFAAFFALVYIYLTGHSGAESVWGWVSNS